MTDEVLVYGRTEYTEPLTERGAVPTGNDLLAAYPGPWVELVAFPREAMYWIVRDGEEAEREHRTAR